MARFVPNIQIVKTCSNVNTAKIRLSSQEIKKEPEEALFFIWGYLRSVTTFVSDTKLLIDKESYSIWGAR